MREIKFRAWRPAAGMFRYFDLSIGFNPENYDKFPPVMQYTGLKDKNGVEIFEGDILQSATFLLVVKWDKCTFLADCLNSTPHWAASVNIAVDRCERAGRPIEVIGNIYEDPELLDRHTRRSEVMKNEVLEHLIEKWRTLAAPPECEDGSEDVAAAEARGRREGQRRAYALCAKDLENLIVLLSP